MRSRKLISYSRGKIIIVRKGLEAASCSCYKKIETLHAVRMSRLAGVTAGCSEAP